MYIFMITSYKLPFSFDNNVYTDAFCGVQSSLVSSILVAKSPKKFTILSKFYNSKDFLIFIDFNPPEKPWWKFWA